MNSLLFSIHVVIYGFRRVLVLNAGQMKFYKVLELFYTFYKFVGKRKFSCRVLDQFIPTVDN